MFRSIAVCLFLALGVGCLGDPAGVTFLEDDSHDGLTPDVVTDVQEDSQVAPDITRPNDTDDVASPIPDVPSIPDVDPDPDDDVLSSEDVSDPPDIIEECIPKCEQGCEGEDGCGGPCVEQLCGPAAVCVAGECCHPPSDETLCLGLEEKCDPHELFDSCGQPRIVECSTCPDTMACREGVCCDTTCPIPSTHVLGACGVELTNACGDVCAVCDDSYCHDDQQCYDFQCNGAVVQNHYCSTDTECDEHCTCITGEPMVCRQLSTFKACRCP
ncbi:MAG: hypothetical protein ACNA8W_00150 [Bradymonadaceae bacterium]